MTMDTGRSPSGRATHERSQSALSPPPVGVPNAAPWWRCLHCGYDEYEEHVFTGHMKGVPMIHCANCQILHSPPDLGSKAALRWQISELAEVLIDWRNTYLCPISDIEESATRLLEATDAALAAVGFDLDAETGCADDQIWADVPVEVLRDAIAAGTQSAETSETSAPSEGCQSGPKGIAQGPSQ